MKQLISFFAVLTLSMSAAMAQQAADNPQVTLHTNQGDIGWSYSRRKHPYPLRTFCNMPMMVSMTVPFSIASSATS